eukprot:s630_g13.t1
MQSFRAKRQGQPLSTAVFPLPSPSLESLAGRGSNLSKKRFRKLAFDRLLHVIVFVLDYLYLGRFPNLLEIGRPMNAAQRSMVNRLRSALTVCGASVDEFPLVPGRSGPELVSRLMQLEHFLMGCPAFVDAYSKLPVSDFSHDKSLLPPEEYPQLVPHKNLNADRIKIVGEGRWPMEQFLRSTLWLPFQEPLFLHHSESIEGASVPCFRFESREECLKLVKLWDSKGLLSLFGLPAKPEMFCRAFQVFKSEEWDRQIGDRRLPNAMEFHIDGPSKFLPQGPMLTQITVPRWTHRVRGSVTDRRDFYHQASVTEERAQTNLLPFRFGLQELEGTQALAEFLQRQQKKKARTDRTLVGDRFGLMPERKGLLVDEVYCGFRSLFQGDHLGVEFALESHKQLLVDGGLLDPKHRILGGHVVPLSRRYEGLIIDDYFALSVDPKDAALDDSFASVALTTARETYERHELLGSVEKDIAAQSHFKAAGAEIDSSDEALKHGMVTVSAPRVKLLALSVLSLRVARLPVVTQKLAQRLTGNWVSVLLYRRCWSSIVADLFALGHDDVCESPKGERLIELPRKCAQELAMLAAVAPLVFSNVAFDVNAKFRASDSSSRKGAFTVTRLAEREVMALWQHADKRGSYTKLDSPVRSIIKELLPETEYQEPALPEGPYKAPLLRFDFLEFYGGAGVVSHYMAELGFVVGPPIDLSLSPHYNMASLRLLEWAIFMIDEDRLLSFLVEPPCTSFSPAAHPSVRSYEVPLGYDRLEKKTFHGNLHAFRSFVLLKVGRRRKRPCGLEQPRLSKMAWLSFWHTLLSMDFEESIIASCAFGSPHRKEFRFLLYGLDASGLSVPCPGSHQHIRIEGRYTKGSAVYVDGLAKHLARGFAQALRSQKVCNEDLDFEGFENPVVNDIMDSCSWTLERDWHWKKQAHINVYETEASVLSLLESAKELPHSRCCFAVDSLVARGALSKGRSSSKKLQPGLRRACAIQIGFDVYPAWTFSPTRLNVPDDPTRDCPFRKPVPLSLRQFLSTDQLEEILPCRVRRPFANWIRLVVLCHCLSYGSACKMHPEHWSTCAFWSLFSGCVFGRICAGLGLYAIGLQLGFLQQRFWTSCEASLSCLSLRRWTFISLSRQGVGITPKLRACSILKVVFLFQLFHLSLGAMEPATADERRRAEIRGDFRLPADRDIRRQTRSQRNILVARFRSWLRQSHGVSLFGLLNGKPLDGERMSYWLAEYGRDMYRAGKAYYQFSEPINGLAMMRPALKKQLGAAWDVAFSWLIDEPHDHHPALPVSVLLASLTLALGWGWPLVAAVLALAWTGIMRIGEVLQAKRSDLILPSDSAPGFDFVLLRIQEPKTRGRHAKHQAARVDQSDVVSLLSAVCGPMAPHEALWPYSAATLRKRFNQLLLAIGLPTERKDGVAPFSLGSLRPGGATWLLHASESSELVRRRGRWLSSRVMEVYLQEILVATFAKKLDPKVRDRIEKLALGFPALLAAAIDFLTYGVPSSTWHVLLRGEAGTKPQDVTFKATALERFPLEDDDVPLSPLLQTLPEFCFKDGLQLLSAKPSPSPFFASFVFSTEKGGLLWSSLEVLGLDETRRARVLQLMTAMWLDKDTDINWVVVSDVSATWVGFSI